MPCGRPTLARPTRYDAARDPDGGGGGRGGRNTVGIISWLVFGALAGWVASLIAGTNRGQGWLANILVGIVGAVVGGFLWALLFDDEVDFGWSIGSFVVAVVGALVLLAVLNLVRRRA